MESPVLNRRIVFLVGSPRSGTTWLQLMLSASEHVATANETHLFSQYLTSLFDTWRRLQRDVREIGLTHLMDEEEFLALVRTFVDDVTLRIMAKKPNAAVILEKTPDHIRNWRQILKIYPQAHFVHLVRDPRAVVASVRAASRGWGGPWTRVTLMDNCARWRLHVKEGQQIFEATPNYVEVRYEDLKRDCAAELHHVFNRIGVAVSEQDCSRIAESYRIDKLRSREVAAAPWDLSKEPEQFYRRGETDGWKDELTRRQIYLIEAMTNDLMEAYRYVRVTKPGVFDRLFSIEFVLGVERIRSGLGWRIRRIANAISPNM